MTLRILFSSLLGFAACSSAAARDVAGFPPALPHADLVVRGANIVTLDALQPRVQALAVKDGRIIAMGSDAQIARYAGSGTRSIDARGAFVTPGFIEGHGHLMQTGESLMQINVGKARNWDGVVAQVRAAVAKARPGEWIVGFGWLESKWDRVPQPNLHGLPLPATLDAASPRNPVLLTTASFHGLYANALALRLAGIGDDTPDPPGGTIVRDAGGRAIGMLKDTAADPVYAAHRKYLETLPRDAQQARRVEELRRAVHNEISKGITTFVDQGADFALIEWLRTQAAAGLPLRLYVNVDGESVASLDAGLAAHRVIDPEHRFTVRGIGESVSDGALGTRSAWMLEPYSDAPGISGKNVTAMADLEAMAKIAARDGFQVSIHAIGDRANREVLDLYQRIFAADPAAHRLRWRIEHAQLLDPADVPRFAAMGIIASMQSIHACSDAPMVEPRLGAQRARQGAYLWKALIDSGAMVLDGSDTPVEDTNPLPGFYCALTRAYDGGRKTFFPGQAKSALQELESYTRNNAYAIFAEADLGSLAPGKLADFVVWSEDLLQVPANRILQTRVLYTVVGGELVYQREGAADWRAGEHFDAMPEFDHAE